MQSQLRRVQWVSWRDHVAAMNADRGCHHHLTDNDGIAGKTLCGRQYPADKGFPSPLAGRWCKRCLNAAYKRGFERGFTKGIESVPSRG